jgi:nitrate/nitrite transporter NarK
MKKYKYLVSSFTLFILCLVTWQITGKLAENTNDMDHVTSFAIYSFLGTVVFLGTTLILLLITILKRNHSVVD